MEAFKLVGIDHTKSTETHRPQWPSMDVATRERQYSPSSMVGGNIEPYLEAYRNESEAARRLYRSAGAEMVELSYGPSPTQTIDLVVPSQPAGPLMVYIHGGYWQQLSKHDSHIAPDLVGRGIGYAAVDYTLAPAADLDSIVVECRQALTHLGAVASNYRLDPDRFIVAGSSAGAHLGAMVTLASNQASTVKPAALVLLSGIYELEPLLSTTINDAVGLDFRGAHRNSPLLVDLSGFPPSLVAWGEIETEEFKRQSRALAAKLQSGGTPVRTLEVAGRNHFDIIHDLGRLDRPLGEAVERLMADLPGRGGTGSD